ncbi:hypothetical protein ABMA27_010074 [Loxostege sticticalis]|uniref:Uncharacterized protein n=1 Tax=Loxostege sticticalis TaxID=481309 RepID=A0ABR3H4J1_LOXSC
MLARFVCVFACVVFAHCLPTRQPAQDVEIGVLDSRLEDHSHEEIIQVLAKKDAISIEKPQDEESQEAKVDVPEEADVVVDDLLEQVSTKEKESENTVAKDETNEFADEVEKSENARLKRDVKDRTDIETIVTVKNNDVGTQKEYYFRTIQREVKGEKYKCKIGLSSGDVIFYYRCLLVSNGITGEGLQETGQGDFFDIA